MCEVVGIGQLLNDVEVDREKVAEEKSEVLDVLLVSSIALLIELFQVGLGLALFLRPPSKSL